MAPEAWRPVMSRRGFLAASLAAITPVLAGCGAAGDAKPITVRREEIGYGGTASQTGDLYVPDRPSPRPVIVLVHGGYWKLGFDRSEMQPMAASLAQGGFAVWNLDYRRMGEAGGGWPGTLEDIAAAVDHLAALAPTRPLDLTRVGIVGHSAGGQLALWAAARASSPPGTLGAAPLVSPVGAVSLAGVLDLTTAAADAGTVAELREAIVALISGGPDQQSERYAQVSPIARLPLGLPQLLLHGARDALVPVEQSRAYVAKASRAGDRVRLIELPAGDHFDVVRTDKPGWDEVVTWLRTNIGDPSAR